MGVGRQSLDRLAVSDPAVAGPVYGLRPFLGRVEEPELQGIHLQLPGQLVEECLRGEGRDRRARRPVGGRLRHVVHHVEALEPEVGDVVGGEHAHDAHRHRRTLESTGLIGQPGLGGHQLPVPARPQLDPHLGTGGRTGPPENLVPGHDHLDRAAGLLRQQRRHRLYVHGGLASESAADLGRNHLDLRRFPSEQLGRVGPHREMPLGRAPDDRAPVLPGVGHRRMRLDVTLVNGAGGELPLHHRIRLGEALRRVAPFVQAAGGDVGGRFGGRIDPFGEHVFVEHGGAGGHRLFHVHHMGQHLVVDLDGLQRRQGGAARGGGRRRQGVAFVEHLAAGHDVAAQVAVIHFSFAAGARLCFQQREVIPRNHRLHLFHRFGGGDVDRPDAGVGVGRAEHRPDQHPRQGQVGAEAGAAGYLVEAVMADRAGSHPLVTGVGVDGDNRTGFSSHAFSFCSEAAFMSAAAASIDRTILS